MNNVQLLAFLMNLLFDKMCSLWFHFFILNCIVIFWGGSIGTKKNINIEKIIYRRISSFDFHTAVWQVAFECSFVICWQDEKWIAAKIEDYSCSQFHKRAGERGCAISFSGLLQTENSYIFRMHLVFLLHNQSKVLSEVKYSPPLKEIEGHLRSDVH